MADHLERTTWQVKVAAEEPLAVVSVRELQTTIKACADAWGRSGKIQPVLISAELWLAQSFDTSSAKDQVAIDTVHYGILSKAILTSLDNLGGPGTLFEGSGTISLYQVAEHIVNEVRYPSVSGDGDRKRIFCDGTRLRYSSITITLPKASLQGVGSGVSWTHHQSWAQQSTAEAFWSDTLRLQALRVATLIGVNDNERLARQVVVTDVDIDNYACRGRDDYPSIESLVVQVMEQSSFETLEALAAAIGARLAEYLSTPESSAGSRWQIKISLEKPTAIPMAQAARVEYRLATNQQNFERLI